MASGRLLDKSLAQELIENVDNVIFDCDGVLWSGFYPLEGAVDTVKKLKQMGKTVYLMTNNSLKSRREYTVKCKELGFQVEEEEMVCSAYVAAQYLHNIGYKGKVYLIGESGVAEELDKFGFSYTGIGPETVEGGIQEWVKTELDPEIKCVLVSFDRHISFPKILKAATYARQKDSIFLATNEDSCHALNAHITMPGTGSLVAAVKIAAQCEPVVLGKPSKHMFKVLEDTFNLDPARTLIVGDNLETDILLARNCGLKSLLVLTGHSTLEDVHKAAQQRDETEKACVPDFYLENLSDLCEMLSVF